MKKPTEYSKLISSLVILIMILFVYQNCGPSFRTPLYSTLNSKGSTCGNSEIEAFNNVWHTTFFVERTCMSCHRVGGEYESQPFADPNISLSFQTFNTYIENNGRNNFCDKAGAQVPTGHGSTIDPAREAYCHQNFDLWEDCINAGGTGSLANFFSTPKVIGLSATPDEGQVTLTWNLSNEIVPGAGNLGGATFSVLVRVNQVVDPQNPTAQPNTYIISNPTIVAQSVPLQIKKITLKVNDHHFDGTGTNAWTIVDSIVLPGQTNVLATGSINLVVTEIADQLGFLPTDTLSVAFETIGADPNGGVTTTTVTTTTLPGGPNINWTNDIQPLFRANCFGCHSGGRPYSVASYAAAINSIYVQPGAAGLNSNLFRRIDGATPLQFPLMPTDGRMSQANVDLVRQWILNGLRENP